MSSAHTSSLRKNTIQMASRATESLSRLFFFFPVCHIFHRKCKIQTRCEMTKGSGVFVLPPHFTKWALRPSRLSKTNIPFGFWRESWLGFWKKRREMPSCLECVSIYKCYIRGRTRGMQWLGDEKTFLSPISPFLISSQSTSRTRHATNILRRPRRSLLSLTYGLPKPISGLSFYLVYTGMKYQATKTT